MSGLKDSYKGGSQIGDIKSINGDSTSLNTQKQEGGEKPVWTGNSNPGNTHPGRASSGKMPVPLP